MIQTILGDTGSITGNIVTIYANNAANDAGSSVYFTNSGTVSTFNLTDGFQNTFLGRNSGGSSQVSVGQNTAIGKDSMSLITNATANTCVGYGSLVSLTTGDFNTCIGKGAGGSLTTGSSNIAIGFSATCTQTGSNNITIGFFAGSQILTSENGNLLINSPGFVGQDNVLSIGVTATPSQNYTKAYIAGIVGNTVAGSGLVTIHPTTYQLGVSNAVVGTWTDVTGATQTLAVGNGYITDNGGGVNYTLPATASLGDAIEIIGKVGITTITPNANQQILIGALGGTIGPAGTAVGTNAGDSIILRCITSGANTVWRGFYNGNWTLN